MSDKRRVQEVGRIVSDVLCDLERHFTKEMRLALIAFDPGDAEKTMLLTNGNLADLEKAVRDRREADNA